MGFPRYFAIFCLIAAAFLSNATAYPVRAELDNMHLKSSTHIDIIDDINTEICRTKKKVERRVCRAGCLISPKDLQACNEKCDAANNPDDC